MLALIDGDIVVYRIAFGAETESARIASHRLSEFMVDLMLYDLPEATDYVGYLTDTEPSNFRYGVAVTHPYKGNRSPTKPVHYQHLREELVSSYGFDVVRGEEADDAIATKSTECGDSAIIVSIDKDLDQVPGWHYNFVKHKKYYVTELEATKNFYTQLLTGDRVDNIVGLNGIGPKGAEKILESCSSAVECYNAVVEAYKDKGESLDRLVENANLLWLRRKPGEGWSVPV